MNTFISHKLGEVIAFAEIGTDTLKKGQKGFAKMLDEKEIDDMKKMFSKLEKRLGEIAKEQGVEKEAKKKAAESKEKIIKMRDMYIDGKWDVVSELLEWTGFYAGASLVHWKLIAGAAKTMKFEELETVSRQAINFYDKLFVSDEEKLQKIGAERVASMKQ